MEILFGFVGVLAGFLLGYIIGKPGHEINWSPNDYTLPEALPMLKLKGMNRGFEVNGASVTQTWEYNGMSQARHITKRGSALTQEEFLEYWYENELNFYLSNKAAIDKANKDA